MTIDPHKQDAQLEHEPRHSALEEFRRDERRPAVLLLTILVIAAVFFALGIMFGRWTTERELTPITLPEKTIQASPSSTFVAPTPQTISMLSTSMR